MDLFFLKTHTLKKGVSQISYPFNVNYFLRKKLHDSIVVSYKLRKITVGFKSQINIF